MKERDSGWVPADDRARPAERPCAWLAPRSRPRANLERGLGGVLQRRVHRGCAGPAPATGHARDHDCRDGACVRHTGRCALAVATRGWTTPACDGRASSCWWPGCHRFRRRTGCTQPWRCRRNPPAHRGLLCAAAGRRGPARHHGTAQATSPQLRDARPVPVTHSRPAVCGNSADSRAPGDVSRIAAPRSHIPRRRLSPLACRRGN